MSTNYNIIRKDSKISHQRFNSALPSHKLNTNYNSFKTLENTVDSSLSEPNEEIFNFRAVNPTVEVYVGQCLEYNEKGECIDDNFQNSDEEDEESKEETEQKTEQETESNGNTENSSGESENGASN